jgi:hypothetical protein
MNSDTICQQNHSEIPTAHLFHFRPTANTAIFLYRFGLRKVNGALDPFVPDYGTIRAFPEEFEVGNPNVTQRQLAEELGISLGKTILYDVKYLLPATEVDGCLQGGHECPPTNSKLSHDKQIQRPINPPIIQPINLADHRSSRLHRLSTALHRRPHRNQPGQHRRLSKHAGRSKRCQGKTLRLRSIQLNLRRPPGSAQGRR